MRELFNRIWTHPKYGAAFLVILVVLFLFLWRCFFPQSFHDKVQGFMNDMMVIVEYLIAFVIVVIGIRVMFGWRPFKKPGKSGH